MWSRSQQWEEGPSPDSFLLWVLYLSPRGNSYSPLLLCLCSVEFSSPYYYSNLSLSWTFLYLTLSLFESRCFLSVGRIGMDTFPDLIFYSFYFCLFCFSPLPPCHSSNITPMSPPHSFCTCFTLCLESSSPRYTRNLLSYILRVMTRILPAPWALASMSQSQWWLFWLPIWSPSLPYLLFSFNFFSTAFFIIWHTMCVIHICYLLSALLSPLEYKLPEGFFTILFTAVFSEPSTTANTW